MAPDKRTSVQTLEGIPEDEWPVDKMVFGVWTIFPHISIAAFDAAGKVYMISQLFPGDNPDESYTTQHFLHTQPLTDEVKEAMVGRMEFMVRVVEDEDYKTGIEIQRGLKSGAMKEVVFGRNEGGTQAFHKWVQSIIEADDTQLNELFAKGVGTKSN
jgi:hypothetical protein